MSSKTIIMVHVYIYISCLHRCTTGREALLSQCENGDYDSGCHSHIRDAGVRCNVPDRSSCANKKPNTVSY